MARNSAAIPRSQPHATRIAVVLGACENASTTASKILDLVPAAPEVILLPTQRAPDLVRTRGIMKDTVERHLREAAMTRAQALQASLSEAGATCSIHVCLSEDPEIILDQAHHLKCDAVLVAGKPLMGAQRLWGRVTGCVGSHLGAQLSAMADLPVLSLPAEGRAS